MCAMKTTVWHPERRQSVIDALQSSRTRFDAAKRLGVTTSSLDHACVVYDLDPVALLIKKSRPVFDPVTLDVPEVDQSDALKARVAELEEQLAALDGPGNADHPDHRGDPDA